MNADHYTDYPFTELGDAPNKEAPIRPVQVISYDGNKYCTVWVEGHQLEVKAGYIYTRPGRCGDVPAFDPKPFDPAWVESRGASA